MAPPPTFTVTMMMTTMMMMLAVASELILLLQNVSCFLMSLVLESFFLLQTTCDHFSWSRTLGPELWSRSRTLVPGPGPRLWTLVPAPDAVRVETSFSEPHSHTASFQRGKFAAAEL